MFFVVCMSKHIILDDPDAPNLVHEARLRFIKLHPYKRPSDRAVVTDALKKYAGGSD